MLAERGEGVPLTVALARSAFAPVGSMSEYAALVEAALAAAACPVVVHRLDLALPASWAGRFPARLLPWANTLWVTGASRRLASLDVDVLHLLDGSHAHIVPARPRTATVVTVHDTIPSLRSSGTFGPNRGSLPARRLLRRVVAGWHAADRVVAVSESTARDLAAAAVEPVDVVPPALSRKAQTLLRRPVQGWAARRAETPYVLHVGHNGFYKNRSGVLRVFARVAEQAEARLVMAGPRPTRELLDLVATLGMTRRVAFDIDPSEQDLAERYRGASLLLFPSLYEGFGLPLLEAMAAGCPVVCSDAASLPEVVGEAGLTASATDERALAQAVVQVLTTPRLAERLIDRGRARAATFSLEAMGDALAKSYRVAIASHAQHTGLGRARLGRCARTFSANARTPDAECADAARELCRRRAHVRSPEI